MRYRDGAPVAIEQVLISTQHEPGAEALIADDLWEHVVEPVLPAELYDAGAAAREPAGQPDRALRDRRPGRRLRAHRAQDHRRHLRRDGPPRRRRVLAARTRRRSTARPPTPRATWPRTRRRRAGRPRRGAGRLRDRRRRAGLGDGRDVRHRDDRRATRIAALVDEHFDLRPRRVPRVRCGSIARSTSRPPPTATSAATARIHLGGHRPRGRAARGRRPRRTRDHARRMTR